jgi:hypothetical protein
VTVTDRPLRLSTVDFEQYIVNLSLRRFDNRRNHATRMPRREKWPGAAAAD